MRIADFLTDDSTSDDGGVGGSIGGGRETGGALKPAPISQFLGADPNAPPPGVGQPITPSVPQATSPLAPAPAAPAAPAPPPALDPLAFNPPRDPGWEAPVTPSPTPVPTNTLPSAPLSPSPLTSNPTPPTPETLSGLLGPLGGVGGQMPPLNTNPVPLGGPGQFPLSPLSPITANPSPPTPIGVGAARDYIDPSSRVTLRDQPEDGGTPPAPDSPAAPPPPAPAAPTAPAGAQGAPTANTITTPDPAHPGSGYINGQRIEGVSDDGYYILPGGDRGPKVGPEYQQFLDKSDTTRSYDASHWNGGAGVQAVDTGDGAAQGSGVDASNLYESLGTDGQWHVAPRLNGTAPSIMSFAGDSTYTGPPNATPQTSGGGGRIGDPNNLTPNDTHPWTVPNGPTLSPLPPPTDGAGAGGGNASPPPIPQSGTDTGTPSSGTGGIGATATPPGGSTLGGYLGGITGGPASQYANVTPTDPNNDLRSQTITPGPALDRYKLAQDQLKTFNDATQPYYDASLRDANRQAAASGRLGSGMLRTSIGDLANQRNLQLETQGQSFLQDALSGSVSDSQFNLDKLLQEQQYQTGAQNQAFNQNVVGQQLQDALTNSSFGRALSSLNAGSANDPSSMLMMLSGLYGNQASSAQQALASLIGGTTANNASSQSQNTLLQYINAMMKGQQGQQSPTNTAPSGGSGTGTYIPTSTNYFPQTGLPA